MGVCMCVLQIAVISIVRMGVLVLRMPAMKCVCAIGFVGNTCEIFSPHEGNKRVYVCEMSAFELNA